MRYLLTIIAGLSLAYGTGLTPPQWGYIDRTGSWVIQPRFSEAGGFDSAGRARVKFVLKEALIDRTGEVRSDTAGKLIASGFSEGLALIRTSWNFKYGWMDTSGHVVAMAAGDKAREFHCSRAWVQNSDGTWSSVNRNDYTKAAAQYDAVDDFSEGVAAVGIAILIDPGDEEEPPIFDWKFGFVDTSMRKLVDLEFEAVRGFSEGRAAHKLHGKWGYIDQSGNTVIARQYDDADKFSEGLACVQIGGRCGCINRAGALVIPATFHGMRPFSEGLAPVAQDNKWGYIDTTGRLVIPTTFDDAQPFSEGLAPVKVSGMWGYVDKTGKLVIPAEFFGAVGFSMGLAAATKEQ